VDLSREYIPALGIAALTWAFVTGLIVFKLIDVVIGLQVSERGTSNVLTSHNTEYGHTLYVTE